MIVETNHKEATMFTIIPRDEMRNLAGQIIRACAEDGAVMSEYVWQYAQAYCGDECTNALADDVCSYIAKHTTYSILF